LQYFSDNMYQPSANGALYPTEGGAPPEQIRVSSGAGGCQPRFDKEGQISAREMRSAGALLQPLSGLAAGAQTVIIEGAVHVRDGLAIRRGTFET
jgi:hypothetical protein